MALSQTVKENENKNKPKDKERKAKRKRKGNPLWGNISQFIVMPCFYILFRSTHHSSSSSIWFYTSSPHCQSRLCIPKCIYKASCVKLTMPVPREMRLRWVIRFSGQSPKVYLIPNADNLAHQMCCSLNSRTLYSLDSASEGERALCVPILGTGDPPLLPTWLGLQRGVGLCQGGGWDKGRQSWAPAPEI